MLTLSLNGPFCIFIFLIYSMFKETKEFSIANSDSKVSVVLLKSHAFTTSVTWSHLCTYITIQMKKYANRTKFETT